MTREKGALPDKAIRKFIEVGCISSDGKTEIPKKNIQPASIDLRVGALGTKVFRVPGVFLPPAEEKIDLFAKKISSDHYLYEIEMRKEGVTLEVGVPYIFPIAESLNLSDGVYGIVNNKSSSGRINLQVRLLCEGHREFDTVPSGYKGPLYILAVAQSFPVNIEPYSTLNQLRLFSGDPLGSQLTRLDIQLEHEKHGLIFDLEGNKIPWKKIKIIDRGIAFSSNLKAKSKNKIIAYRFKGTATHSLPLSSRNCDPFDYFESIYEPSNGYLSLAKGGFYIISTNEAFNVPPNICAEMVPYSIRAGEYRSHFAGFFDPGWGFNKKGLKGTPGVLEVIPHEDILIFHGGTICIMDLYHMTEEPEEPYGRTGSHYQYQTGPRLSKHFKQ